MYNKIIELGQQSTPLYAEDRIPENLVKGCQSKMYLKTTFDGEKMHFAAEADAFSISAGLAVLLIMVYNEEIPEVVLKCPPTYLEKIGITSALFAK